MGGVNTARHYASMTGFGYFDEEEGLVRVTKPLLQGGIVAVYYLPGTLLGALFGGWLGKYRTAGSGPWNHRLTLQAITSVALPRLVSGRCGRSLALAYSAARNQRTGCSAREW